MSEVLVSRNGKVFHESFCPYILRTEKKNRLAIEEEEAVQRGYCECSFCRSVQGLVYKYRRTGYKVFYDPVDNAACFLTEIGFWKAIWMDDEEKWKLYHLNHCDFDPEKDPKELMRCHFHRQKDVILTSSLWKIVAYIQKHDRSRAQSGGDYHKMPTTTQKQRKYRNSAKKRAKKKSIRNVYKILDQIKMEGES